MHVLTFASFACVAFIIWPAFNVSQSKATDKTETNVARKCYSCSGTKKCIENPKEDVCSPDKPYCATLSSSSNGFESELVCSEDIPRICHVKLTDNIYNLTCSCKENLCNKVFAKEVMVQLRMFSLQGNTDDHNLTDIFFAAAFDTDMNNSLLYDLVTGVGRDPSSDGNDFGTVVFTENEQKEFREAHRPVKESKSPRTTAFVTIPITISYIMAFTNHPLHTSFLFIAAATFLACF